MPKTVKIVVCKMRVLALMWSKTVIIAFTKGQTINDLGGMVFLL